jgi:DNA-binding transcriptional MerR regulator
MRTHDAAALAGVSYRQVNHWQRRGWVRAEHPNGDGSGRPYLMTDEEVRLLVLMGRLVRAGFTPERAAGLVRGSLGLNGIVTLGKDLVLEDRSNRS